jgi:hypothetical protein
MKTRFFFLLGAVFFTQAVMAQLHIGAKAGANIVKIDGQSFKDKFSYGYHVGGFAEIGFGGKLGIQPEVMFSQYSTTLDSNFSHIYESVFNNSAQSHVKLGYLSIPILLNYKLLCNFLTLQVGPQYSILIDQNKNLLENGQEAFKKGEFAMVGGAQIKLASFRITGRYIIGLNNLNDIDNQDKWKSQVVQLSLGFAL